MLFSSPNTMEQWNPGRKDDLISLYYLIVFITNGDLPFDQDEDISIAQNFENILRSKLEMTPEKNKQT